MWLHKNVIILVILTNLQGCFLAFLPLLPYLTNEKMKALKEGVHIPRILAYPKSLHPVFDKQHSMQVHSVYKSTINVEMEQWFLALQPTGLPLTPMSITLDLNPSEFEHLPVQKGDPIYFDNLGIQIGATRFVLNQAKPVECGITDLQIESERELQRLSDGIARNLFAQIGKGELLLAARQVLTHTPSQLSSIGRYLAEVLEQLDSMRETEAVVKYTLRLLGVGEGLTPSGDDFLCGLLASLTLLNHLPNAATLRERLSASLRENLSSTSRISREYLLHAMEGQFTALVRQLVLVNAQEQDFVPVLNELRSIGHSSGSDFLIGMYFGLTLGGNGNL